MANHDPAPIFDAFHMAEQRGLMPTSLGTAELRELGAGILARSVFTARGTSAIYVTRIKEVVDEMASGSMDFATARVTLLETLRAMGYTPEGGFPDDPPGTVPPAVAGSLRDLSSFRRLDLIVRTQYDLMQGAGQQYRGHTPDRLEASPAWELVRVEPRVAPRDWMARWRISGGLLYGDISPELASNGTVRATGRMIALKGDPVWGELGSWGNFSDALGVDFPPFAFNSGMGWREVSREEAKVLGVTGPDGESIEDFQSSRPVTLHGKLPLPAPSLSVKDVDPDLLSHLEQETFSEAGDGLLDFSDLLAQAMAKRVASYERREP